MLTGGDKMYVFSHEKSQTRWIVACKGLQAYKEPDGEALGELPNWSMALGKTFLYEVERTDGWMKYELMPHCKAKMDETLHTGWVPMSMNGEATLETWAKHGWDRCCYVHGDKKGYNQLYLEKEDGQTEDELFDSLRDFDEANYLMTAAIAKEEKSVRNGLSPMHSYSLLRVVQAGGFKMICLRNPHARNEWKGPWSDQSDEWEKHPEVAADLQTDPEKFDKDGIFWMDFQDFLKVFDGIGVMAKSLPGKRAEFRLDLGDDWNTIDISFRPECFQLRIMQIPQPL